MIKELKQIYIELSGNGCFEGILVPDEILEKLAGVILNMELEREYESAIFRARIEIIK